MKRLTFLENEKWVLKQENCVTRAGKNEELAQYAIDRLAAYEDTGLEPQVITETQEWMRPISFNRIREIMNAEAEGRLVVLPCKVGDTVYRICPKCNDKHDGSCENCAWRSCMTNCGCTTYGLWGDGQFPPDKCTIVPYRVFWNYIPNMIEKFGKTVFLTSEEAEEVLRRKNDEN